MWKLIKRIFLNQLGQITFSTLLATAIVIIAVFPALYVALYHTSNASMIRSLSDDGYVVLGAGEYNNIMVELLDAEAAALAAATKADLAAAKVDLYNSARRYVYPDSSNVTVTFTAPVAINTFGAWAEITDNSTVKLSSVFATDNGYLSEMVLEDFSAKSKVYIIEIAYGAAKTPVAVKRFFAETEGQELEIRSCLIPLGQLLYYRMMCNSTAATLECCFRYIYD